MNITLDGQLPPIPRDVAIETRPLSSKLIEEPDFDALMASWKKTST